MGNELLPIDQSRQIEETRQQMMNFMLWKQRFLLLGMGVLVLMMFKAK